MSHEKALWRCGYTIFSLATEFLTDDENGASFEGLESVSALRVPLDRNMSLRPEATGAGCHANKRSVVMLMRRCILFHQDHQRWIMQ